MKALRRREGRMAQPHSRYQVFYQLNLGGTKSALNREVVLRRAFPAVSSLDGMNKGQRQNLKRP